MTDASTTSTLQDAKAVKGTRVVIPVDYSEARAHLVALNDLVGGHPWRRPPIHARVWEFLAKLLRKGIQLPDQAQGT
jgi:hypothetical protein